MNGLDLRYLSGRKTSLDLAATLPHWSLFISAYNESERVRSVFDRISADEKLWVVLPEYKYGAVEIAHLQNSLHCNADDSESTVIKKMVELIGADAMIGANVCVDITGFMRPHILFLLHFLQISGAHKVSMLYTEPDRYARKEHTILSTEEIMCVRQVHGFEGVHHDEMEKDILLVGIGYDDALISRVINDKDSARVVQLLSLPSLSADMYQESILRLDRTGAADSGSGGEIIFAPANDPFVIASELSAKVSELEEMKSLGNLYLCPLATKPQALGFGLFYLSELQGGPSSIVFPFARSYDRETSTGLGRSWIYEVVLS
jgi:hypothetical protein